MTYFLFLSVMKIRQPKTSVTSLSFTSNCWMLHIRLKDNISLGSSSKHFNAGSNLPLSCIPDRRCYLSATELCSGDPIYLIHVAALSNSKSHTQCTHISDTTYLDRVLSYHISYQLILVNCSHTAELWLQMQLYSSVDTKMQNFGSFCHT